MPLTGLGERVADRIRDWSVEVEAVRRTASSCVVFGTRHHQPAVLKVVRPVGDEWRCGEVMQAFA